MSKETLKMRSIRLEREVLIDAVEDIESNKAHMRRAIRLAWGNKEKNPDAMSTIRKLSAFVRKENDKLRVVSRMLYETKHMLRKLNRQHDLHNKAIASSANNAN
jgi:hypothetical protein